MRNTKTDKSEAEWQEILTPEQFNVTRKHATEHPFSHPFNDEHRDGTFTCVCCGEPLFSSTTKFNSGTGWPSFTAPISDHAVEEHTDRKFFVKRTEIRCTSCDAHLGHVFQDGPQPTGLRYCMNGVAFNFTPSNDG